MQPGIASAATIAVMLAQKPPQFAQGGFSDSDPAGFAKGDTIYRKSSTGRPVRAGEAGREWIAPNWMLENPRTAQVIGQLEQARTQRAFAMGSFNGSGSAAATSVNVDLQPLVYEMRENTKAIERK
ncbi:MAG: Phage tail tape measure protein family, core region [Daejeonella sp.]|nr:Phage tail tape measure protein family, core region [Daejeonella sp.]